MFAGSLAGVPTVSARAEALMTAARKLDEAPYTRQEREDAQARQAVQVHQQNAERGTLSTRKSGLPPGRN
jgi:hypothetical protein